MEIASDSCSRRARPGCIPDASSTLGVLALDHIALDPRRAREAILDVVNRLWKSFAARYNKIVKKEIKFMNHD